jgi:hypothetical protein
LQFSEFIEALARLAQKIKFENQPLLKKEKELAWKFRQVINLLSECNITKLAPI